MALPQKNLGPQNSFVQFLAIIRQQTYFSVPSFNMLETSNRLTLHHQFNSFLCRTQAGKAYSDLAAYLFELLLKVSY